MSHWYRYYLDCTKSRVLFASLLVFLKNYQILHKCIVVFIIVHTNTFFKSLNSFFCIILKYKIKYFKDGMPMSSNSTDTPSSCKLGGGWDHAFKIHRVCVCNFPHTHTPKKKKRRRRRRRWNSYWYIIILIFCKYWQDKVAK